MWKWLVERTFPVTVRAVDTAAHRDTALRVGPTRGDGWSDVDLRKGLKGGVNPGSSA